MSAATLYTSNHVPETFTRSSALYSGRGSGLQQSAFSFCDWAGKDGLNAEVAEIGAQRPQRDSERVTLSFARETGAEKNIVSNISGKNRSRNFLPRDFAKGDLGGLNGSPKGQVSGYSWLPDRSASRRMEIERGGVPSPENP